MSGHSKWSNIKRKKGVTDAKRSKEFSKLSRLITVAAKKGGDPDANPTLRLAVDKAKIANMPKDNIEKAIQKGSGAGQGDSFSDVTYEGYGPGGVAFLVTALTDNNNRTVAEIKAIFNKSGGSLGSPGSTSFMFDPETKDPTYILPVDDIIKEKTLKLAESLEDNDDVQDIYFNIDL